MTITQYISEYDLKLDSYGVLRKGNGKPNCPNELLERIVKKKLGQGLTPVEENLYGYLAMTLARIVLNNKAMKYQEEAVRMECFSEMMTVLADVERNFNWDRGSKYYSYLFNAMYHAGIHVLEQKNMRTELAANLIQERMDSFLDCGCRIGPVGSQTTEGDIRKYFIREFDEDVDS